MLCKQSLTSIHGLFRALVAVVLCLHNTTVTVCNIETTAGYLGIALSNPAIISLAMVDTTLKYSSGNSTSPSKTFCIVSPSSSPRNGDAPLNLQIYHTFYNNE